MRRLLLLRHAKTERAEPGERDRERKLTARGRADEPVIGAYMARHRLFPDLALVSPATRAEETWELVAAALKPIPRVRKEARIYNASSQALGALISETRDAPTLLVVGHNPGLHDLAVQLVASGEADARANLKEKLPTSGLVVIDFPFDAWSALNRNSGRLERFVSPRLITESAD